MGIETLVTIKIRDLATKVIMGIMTIAEAEYWISKYRAELENKLDK